MFCSNCGQKIENDAVFCGSCGTRFVHQPPTLQQTGLPPIAATPFVRAEAQQAKPKSKVAVICIIVAVAVLAILLVLFLGTDGGADRPLSAAELLTLGERYLLDLNFEQALVQFLALIDIEPRNPRGYTGAAEAYVGLGQYEEAVAILLQGLEELPGEESIITALNLLEPGFGLAPDDSVFADELPPDEPLPSDEEDGDEEDDAVINEQDSGAWRQFYIDIINSYRDTHYFGENVWSTHQAYQALLFVDDNEIPELLLINSDPSTAGNSARLYTATNYGVDYIWFSYANHLLHYIERGNRFLITGGRMGYYIDVVFEIDNGQLIAIYGGERFFPYSSGGFPVYDDYGNMILDYFWGGVEVSGDEYRDALGRAFDFNLSINLCTLESLAGAYISGNFTPDELIEIIEAFGRNR